MVRSVLPVCVVSFCVSLSQAVHFAGVLGGPDAASETMLALDADHSGFIDMKEIGVLIQRQGIVLSPEELKADFQDLDKDGDGLLGEAELRGVIGESTTPKHTADELDKPDTAMAPAPILASSPAAIPSAALAKMSDVSVTKSADVFAPAAVLASPAAIPSMALGKMSDVSITESADLLAPSAILASPAAIPRALPAKLSDESAAASVDWLDDSLLLEVREQAGKFLAATFAKQAEEAFARSKQSAESAVALEAAAQSHRQNASKLVAAAPGDVADAVSYAVASDIHHNTAAVSAMRSAAVQADAAAQESRGEAGAAMDKATQAQTEMMSAIQKLQVPGA